MGKQLNDECNTYKRIEAGSKYYPGRSSIRSLLDSFDIDGPEGQHRCLVHLPLWDSVMTFLHRNPIRRLPVPVLAVVLQRLFMALDYLHTECELIHTGTCCHLLTHSPTSLLELLANDSLTRPQGR